MCIAIYKPQGLVLTPTTIQESWSSNRDGAGFMYHEAGKLHVVKGLMTLPEFKEAYEPHKNKECVLHFRIKTHGEINAEMTHPFLVDDNLGIVHNGIISKVDTKPDPSKSDTYHFTGTHLHRFHQDNPKFFLDPVYKEIIEDYIGFSKLIFMDGDGNVEIFNESKGVWDAGCWFSNKSYQPYVAPQSYNRWNQKPKHTQTQEAPWSAQAKPSDDNLKQGDTCQTQFDIHPGIKGDLDFTIPAMAWVKISYFKAMNVVGVEEILTGLKAEVHVSFLKTIKEIKLEEDKNVETVSIQNEQFQLEDLSQDIDVYSGLS
jgi:hypothetical protein